MERDGRGRFVTGNTIASAGGRARAAALSPRRRKAIARKGRQSMVARHFAGDDRAQRRYIAALGAYVYDQMAGAGRPGSPLRSIARHPGTIQEWRSRYYQLDLFRGTHLDVEF